MQMAHGEWKQNIEAHVNAHAQGLRGLKLNLGTTSANPTGAMERLEVDSAQRDEIFRNEQAETRRHIDAKDDELKNLIIGGQAARQHAEQLAEISGRQRAETGNARRSQRQEEEDSDSEDSDPEGLVRLTGDVLNARIDEANPRESLLHSRQHLQNRHESGAPPSNVKFEKLRDTPAYAQMGDDYGDWQRCIVQCMNGQSKCGQAGMVMTGGTPTSIATGRSAMRSCEFWNSF